MFYLHFPYGRVVFDLLKWETPKPTTKKERNEIHCHSLQLSSILSNSIYKENIVNDFQCHLPSSKGVYTDVDSVGKDVDNSWTRTLQLEEDVHEEMTENVPTTILCHSLILSPLSLPLFLMSLGLGTFNCSSNLTIISKICCVCGGVFVHAQDWEKIKIATNEK